MRRGRRAKELMGANSSSGDRQQRQSGSVERCSRPRERRLCAPWEGPRERLITQSTDDSINSSSYILCCRDALFVFAPRSLRYAPCLMACRFRTATNPKLVHGTKTSDTPTGSGGSAVSNSVGMQVVETRFEIVSPILRSPRQPI